MQTAVHNTEVVGLSPASLITVNPGIRDGYRGLSVLRSLIRLQAQSCTPRSAYVLGQFCFGGRILHFVWDKCFLKSGQQISGRYYCNRACSIYPDFSREQGGLLGQFWVTPPKTIYKYMQQNVWRMPNYSKK